MLHKSALSQAPELTPMSSGAIFLPNIYCICSRIHATCLSHTQLKTHTQMDEKLAALREQVFALEQRHDTVTRECSEKFQELFPVGTTFKRGLQTYKVIRHSKWFQHGIFRVKVRNVNNKAHLDFEIPYELHKGNLREINTQPNQKKS